MTSLIEAIGWVGALLVLVAYGLVSAGRVSSRSMSYQALNVGGAIGLVINSGWKGAIPSAALNLIWIGIGAYALAARRAASTSREASRTLPASATPQNGRTVN